MYMLFRKKIAIIRAQKIGKCAVWNLKLCSGAIWRRREKFVQGCTTIFLISRLNSISVSINGGTKWITSHFILSLRRACVRFPPISHNDRGPPCHHCTILTFLDPISSLAAARGHRKFGWKCPPELIFYSFVIYRAKAAKFGKIM